jgi:hypothetical protein
MIRRWKILSLLVLSASLGVSSLSFSYVTSDPIKAGDSLWRIAASHRIPHVSTAKMVRAIQALNPSSVKKLHMGSTLKIPSSLDEVQSALALNERNEKNEKKVDSDSANKTLVTPSANSSSAPVTKNLPEASSASTSIINKAPATSALLKSNDVVPADPSKANQNNLTQAATPRQTTQLMSPVVLATQPASTQVSAVSAISSQNEVVKTSSFWAWVWFAGLLAALAFGWRNRFRLFSRLQGGKDIAARRLGLHRTEHEQAFDTDVLWKKGKPSYGEHPFKEGDSMAQAMIQMAEGEYLEAKKTLTEAVSRDPKNIELRMKLLENYVALNDRESFKRESDDLLENLMDEADPRWGKIKNMYLRKWAYDAI